MYGDRPLILSIEDDGCIREGICSYLEDAGLRVSGAADGAEGLELFRKHQPDITLLDLRLPGMDGIDVLKSIRAESPEAAVIVISGRGGMEDAIESLRHGAWDYLTKPIHDLRSLRESIERALRRLQFLREHEARCKDLQKQVVAKSVALREVLESIDSERQKLGQQVESNVQRMIFPALRSFKQGLTRQQQRTVEQIEQGLQEIVSPFIDQVSRDVASLTPTELRVCTFIKRGLAVKEIAELEHLSPEPVAAHRRSIRRKLGIANQKVNLTTYLQTVFAHSNSLPAEAD